MAAHNLGINIVGKTVVMKERTMTGTTGDVRSRLVRIHAGNGCDPNGMGNSIFGYFLANHAQGKELVSLDGQDIERLATDREIEMA